MQLALALGGNLWDDVLARIEPKIARRHYATWWQPTAYVRHTETLLLVRVPNLQWRDWLWKFYGEQLVQALTELQVIQLVVFVAEDEVQ